MPRKWVLFFAVLLAVVLLDQGTKIWVYTNIDYRFGEIEVIPGLFSIVHAQNPGALAGFLKDFAYKQYVFLSFTLFALVILAGMVRELKPTERFLPFTLALISAGAVGNAIDRVHKGTVTDFLRFYTEHETWHPWMMDTFGAAEWPSFNVADMALVIGIGLFLIHYLYLEEPEPDAQGASEADKTPVPS